MKSGVNRRTVNLAAFPDLVVIYLGMRVNAMAGIKTILGFGPRIAKAVEEQPDGLLLHESLLFSLFPPHVGMRQYWRDFESLERWSRSAPHKEWWQSFLRNSGGTGFWHEAYFARGGMEAIYDNVPQPIGFMRFAPIEPARGSLFSARKRLGLQGEPQGEDPIVEAEFYGNRRPGKN